jgi:ribosomal protein L37E
MAMSDYELKLRKQLYGFMRCRMCGELYAEVVVRCAKCGHAEQATREKEAWIAQEVAAKAG